jgi:hypothetical protein
VEATFEIIRILATFTFFLLLIVGASLLILVVGIVLFATGEGVMWLRSLRARLGSDAPGSVRFRRLPTK